MKASSSDASNEDGADDEELEFDYRDFFSVLMYYAHMSKEDIMNSSRPFLHGIYRVYVKRACENLGVSPDGNKEESEIQEDGYQSDQAESDIDDYPTEFRKLAPRERREAMDDYSSTQEFLSQFPMAAQFRDAAIRVDKHKKEDV